MDLEAAKTLIEWYHNDEAQLIIITATMIALLGASLGALYTIAASRRVTISVGIGSIVIYFSLFVYSFHLSKRMELIREELSNKIIDKGEHLTKYASSIVEMDYHHIHPVLFLLLPIAIYITIAMSMIKNGKLKLPAIVDSNQGR